MKTIILTIFAAFVTLMAIALPGEEAMYFGPSLSYSVEKGTGKVFINLDIENPEDLEEIKVVRSDNPVKYFRQVKFIGSNDISKLTGSDVLTDNYPLPGSKTSFYKVVTIDKSGVQKSYPSVKLNKY